MSTALDSSLAADLLKRRKLYESERSNFPRASARQKANGDGEAFSVAILFFAHTKTEVPLRSSDAAQQPLLGMDVRTLPILI